MCGKVVRKEGMGRDSSKLQYKVYKPDLHNTTTIFCRLSVYCERAWQCGRMCMRVILHIVGNCIDAYLHYSTVCAAPAQNTSQLRQIGQLSRNDL